jgi:hypothetical protein
MRTPRYLPGVRNGVVAKRQGRSKNPSTSKSFSGGGVGARNTRQRRNSRRFSIYSRDRRQNEGRGARVMWLMILTGMALATGFVFALRSQFNAYRIAQAEEQLKVKLDEYSRRQKYLELDKQRALSASESDRAARWNGLENLKLDREDAQSGSSVQRVVSARPIKASQADQSNRLGNRLGDRLTAESRNGSRSTRGPVRAGSQSKAAKLVKGVNIGKAAKVMNVVKLNAAKREGATNKARANAVKSRKQNQR